MSEAREQKKPRPFEDFRRALEEEMEVSSDYGLPLTVLVVSRPEGWDEGSARRVLDVLRTADFIARPGPSELAIGLPNTARGPARSVERRVREAAPEVSVGVAAWDAGDTVDDLLQRARGSAR